MRQNNAINNENYDEIDILENMFEFIIPKFREAHDVMVSMLDFTTKQEIRISDLGSGFGELAGRILKTIPTSIVFAIDKHPLILERSKQKIGLPDRFIPFQRDLMSEGWAKDLSSIDAVVSSFTLDYIENVRHRELLNDIYQLLNPGGRLVTCEFFRAADNRINKIFHDIEIQYIQKELENGKITSKDIERLSNSQVLRQERFVVSLDDKIKWLKAAGYKFIEIPWKFLNLAVISAKK